MKGTWCAALPLTHTGSTTNIRGTGLRMDRETISHYRLLEKLGSGGMGVVYAAEDMKLGRKVALKFLSVEYSRDAVALQRFEREARAASALNHPNICTIYEIDECDGYRFMAMELLKGMTLRDRIAREPLRGDQLLDFAVQIATGLEAAHSEDIIHRDIKPANIFVTTHGYVKVLDFGLAKLSADPKLSAVAHAGGETQISETMPSDVAIRDNLTMPGVTLGTVAYMSPEQALGETLDARTDLFSFGAVLYQMATGRQAFAGNTAAATVDAILHKIPLPVARFNPEIAPEMQSIINKALEKDRNLRYQNATDLRCDLQRLRRDSQSSHLLLVHEEDSTQTLPGIASPLAPPSAPVSVPMPVPGPPSASQQLTSEISQKKLNLALVLGALALIVVVAIGAVAWWRSRVPATTAAFLRIQAKPAAQVLIDQKPSGTVGSDGTVSLNVPPGEHSVQLTLQGFEPYSASITLSPGEHESLVAQMNPAPPPPPAPVELGMLVLRSNIAGADILVDGQLKGFTERANEPMNLQLNQGAHKVQLKKSGYNDSSEQAIEISAKQENPLSFTLQPSADPASAPAATYLAIRSKPGAEIRIDGNVSGTVDSNGTLPVKVDPGKHAVEASLNGYEPFSSTVTAKASAKTFLVADLKAAVPVVTFSASQQKVEAGQSTNLKWTTQNAGEVRIDPGIGTVAPNGAQDVSPAQTTTYLLTAKGNGGSATAKASVEVGPKSANPADVQGIKETLARFKGAYDSMDIAAIQREWPSLTQTQADAMKTTFVGLVSLRLNDDCDGVPTITGDAATWTCRETLTYVLEQHRKVLPVHKTVMYHFNKAGGKWYIDSRAGAPAVKSAGE
jgi:serine/threonine protein kinase